MRTQRVMNRIVMNQMGDGGRAGTCVARCTEKSVLIRIFEMIQNIIGKFNDNTEFFLNTCSWPNGFVLTISLYHILIIIEQYLFRWINFVIIQTFLYIWQHCRYPPLTLTYYGITEYGMDSNFNGIRLVIINQSFIFYFRLKFELLVFIFGKSF